MTELRATRRRFLGAAAATGLGAAVTTLLPASRAGAAVSTLLPSSALKTTPASRSNAAQSYFESQRQAGLAAIRHHLDLPFLTGTQLAAMLLARDITSVELTERFLARIDQLNGDGMFSVPSRNPDIPVYGNNGKLNAYVRTTPDLALSIAREADKALDAAARRGPAVPFGCGVPVALKDIYAVAGVELTIGCPLAAGNVATGDSVVAERVRNAHMPILGLTPTPARGPTTTPARRRPTRGTARSASVDRPAARPRPSRPGSRYWPPARTPATHCATRRRTSVSARSNRVTGWYRSTA